MRRGVNKANFRCQYELEKMRCAFLYMCSFSIFSIHMSTECPKRLVPCRSCKKEFVADTLATHHGKCGRFSVQCPNRCGTPSIPREELETHLKEKCSGIIMPCIFKDSGCKFKVCFLLSISFLLIIIK